MGSPTVRQGLRPRLTPWVIVALFLVSGVAVGGTWAGHVKSPPRGAALLLPSLHPSALPPSNLVGLPHAKGALHHSLHGLSVYPYNFYFAEPAPMGIADFGVDNTTVNAYRYVTSSFLGTAVIHKLTLYNSGLGTVDYDGTMQLNVVLHFSSGGNDFAYWVQDVLYISTSSNTASFENNIWNFTDGNQYGMLSSTVSGGGTVSSFNGIGYYYAAAGSQSGNGLALSYPATVQLRVNCTSNFGVPRVIFQFDDGKGWQTYDTVKFGFTSSARNTAYVVDGNSNAYNYLFNDAELDWGGPGGGASTTMTAGSIEMSLQFYNGYNYQGVPNAFNFGSNTGESVSNVLAVRYVPAGTGQAESLLSSSANGTLKNLYDRTTDALFNGTTALATGTVAVNGRPLGTFVNHGVNLTLVPGYYNISLWVNGTPRENVTVHLVAGQYYPYDFDYHYHPPGTFPILFTSRGLPNGTSWGVIVYNVNANSSSNSLITLIPNGTFRWVVGYVPGYRPNITGGFVTINGQGKNFSIGWSLVRYTVTAVAVGLPPNTAWTIDLNGSSSTVSGTSVQTQLANGSYAFSVTPIPGYRAQAASGNFTVRGADFVLTITFVRVLYLAEFTETGLPTSTGWVIEINGANHSTGGSALALELPNGTYPYVVSTGSPYLPTPARGTLTVNGSASPVPIVFGPQPGTVYGVVLPGNATFLVNGSAVTLNSGNYSIQLPPGAYRIVVTAPGFHAYYYNFTIAPGQPLRVNVHLTPVSPTQIGQSIGPPSFWTPLTILILIGVVAAVGVGLAAWASRRPRSGA